MNNDHGNRGPLFETSDLHLAAFLLSRGFNLKDMRHLNGRTSFLFTESEEVRGAVLNYANDGEVKVRSFCNALRDLKALTRL